MREVDKEIFDNTFSKALNLFNEQKWYEAHDAFEDIWNTLDGDERQIIQGILQVSVSQFHLSRGNFNGATILLGEGLGRIKTRTSVNLGVDLVSFCNALDSLLNKLQHNHQVYEKDLPCLKVNKIFM